MEGVAGCSSLHGNLCAQLSQFCYAVRCFLSLYFLFAPMLMRMIRFGPNTFPAHNSVIYASEVQAEYIARTMIAPLLDRKISTLEVKGPSEDQWVNNVQSQLKGTVFEAGCSNWYINQSGRNSASWPGYASTYWKETLIPRPGDFIMTHSSRLWVLNMIKRWIFTSRKLTFGVVAALVALGLQEGNATLPIQVTSAWDTGLFYFKLAIEKIWR